MLRVRCEILRFVTSLCEVGMLLFGHFQERHQPLRLTPHLPTGPARPARILPLTRHSIFRLPRTAYSSGNKHRFRFFSSTSENKFVITQRDLRSPTAQPLARRTSSRHPMSLVCVQIQLFNPFSHPYMRRCTSR